MIKIIVKILISNKIIALSFLFIIFLSWFLLSNNSICRNCNVILISIDTFSAKHLGLYGYDRPTTPFLDKFSKEKGIIFENAISQAPWTLPSHTAMLTSKYPYELGIWEPTDSLPKQTKTIAQALKENGFVTQAFSNGAFVQPEWGFDKGFDGFSGTLAENGWNDSPKIFRDSLNWIDKNKKSPFFLFVHSFHLHDPYIPSEKSIKALGGNGVQAFNINEIVSINNEKGGPSVEDSEKLRLAYDGEIRDLDNGLSEFFNGLKSRGLLQNTIIIFTADHGEEFGEHGTAGFHLSLNDEVLHVPLILFLPQGKYKRVKNVVEVRSIPSTITKLLGLNLKNVFDTNSLLDYVSGSNQPENIALSFTALQRKSVLETIETSYSKIEQFGKTIFPKPRTEAWTDDYGSSARSLNWHLIHNADDSFELYDLRIDKNEKNNIYSKWQTFDSNDRKLILGLFRGLDINIPAYCGIYCQALINE